MRSPLEHIIHIREVLLLTQDDLSYVLCVNRKTLCQLIKGNEPTYEQLKNIHRLSRAANDIRRLNIHRIDKLLKKPIFSGVSLLYKLRSNEDFSECAKELKKMSDESNK